MNEDQSERYAILLQTKGNKDYLFADDPYVSAGSDYLKYDIPGEALTDQRFANMIREAEKYLGYPYVWGGSSPSTSFDCSGFVCYVIDHCGNGWNVGRTTAEGLRNYCKIIRPSDARPGDDDSLRQPDFLRIRQHVLLAGAFLLLWANSKLTGGLRHDKTRKDWR